MPNKYSPLLHTQKKGYKFKQSEDGKKILPEIRVRKTLKRPHAQMRSFVDEKICIFTQNIHCLMVQQELTLS